MKKIIIPAAIYFLLLVFFPTSSIETAKWALKLCAQSIIPSLFPFFVCSNVLINSGAANFLAKLLNPLMKPLFGLGGSCSLAVIMGYISGYPVGAKTATDLYTEGLCTKAEAEKLLAFCNNCGPMFVIGALGTGMLGEPGAGIMLYLSHILTSLTIAFVFRSIPACPVNRKITLQNKNISFGEIFSDAISTSTLLTLNICGYIIMFALLISFINQFGIISALSSLGINYELCKSLIYGLTECSGGCMAIVDAIPSSLPCYMLLSSVLSWSGLCVHMQVLGIIKKAKLSPGLYFKGKVMSAIISPLITMFLYGFKTGRLKPLSFIRILLFVFLALFCIIKLFLILRQLYFRYSAHPPR